MGESPESEYWKAVIARDEAETDLRAMRLHLAAFIAMLEEIQASGFGENRWPVLVDGYVLACVEMAMAGTLDDVSRKALQAWLWNAYQTRPGFDEPEPTQEA
jgi:hypothetical protein